VKITITITITGDNMPSENSPEYEAETSVADLPVGRIAYTIPWVLYRFSEGGDYFISASVGTTAAPGGTHTLALIRTPTGVDIHGKHIRTAESNGHVRSYRTTHVNLLPVRIL
jgi:hypothetical protein